MPTESDPSIGAAFVDLDGNGVTDLVQSTYTLAPSQGLIEHAWLNKFRPPVIWKFPNALARKSEISYAVITMAAAQSNGTYADAPSIGVDRTRMAIPMRVVASMLAEDGRGIGVMATTTYQYHSLRASSAGRGPQGFARVEVTDPAMITTSTDYSQVHPYSGLATDVVRYFNLGGRPPTGTAVYLTETHTKYCNSLQEDQNGDPICTFGETTPGTPIHVYPARVTDTSYLHVGDISATSTATAHKIVATSNFRYDTLGNPVRTTVTTATIGQDPQTYEKKTESTYGTPGSLEQQLGKVTRSVVTSRRVEPAGNSIVHTTDFEYGTVAVFIHQGLEILRLRTIRWASRRRSSSQPPEHRWSCTPSTTTTSSATSPPPQSAPTSLGAARSDCPAL